MNRKVIMIFCLISFVLIGCNKFDTKEAEIEVAIEEVSASREMESETETESETIRLDYGRYFTNGTVITSDGNEWGYTTTEISGKEPYDGMPIIVIFSEAMEIENDIIKGVIYDRETAIYDALENEMGTCTDWEVTRNGNEIRIEIVGENGN